ncbi:MAG: type II toxin-antitoxin system VapC family toxin [Burkholderiaceae bacterium]|nr:type II toxin-antitoxin system VapC family toxin [Burkholderiaceae bacterium]MEB2318179.1 type II toxin-antitoxin system VapC family toxin [Pseudomonadota bacterium]
MIVVDTSVLAYLLIPGKYTESAERLLVADPDWAAPRLWRSELRNVLATYVRKKLMEVTDAATLHQRAAALIGTEEYDVETMDVLRLSKGSGCSAYDCEFIALADYLGVELVTTDTKLAKAFPVRARLLSPDA